MTGITNTQIMDKLHDIDVKLEKHISSCVEQEKKTVEMYVDINGNGDPGMKFKNKTMWNERGERKGWNKETILIVIASVINGLMTAGNIFNKF